MKIIKQDGTEVILDVAQESFGSCAKHVEGYITTLSVPGKFVMLLNEDAELKRLGPNFVATSLLQAFSDRSDTLLGPVIVLETQDEVDAIIT